MEFCQYGISSVLASTFAPPLILLLIYTLIAFNILAVSIRRCNDIGISPIWSLVVFLVPTVGWLFIGCLGSSRSHEGLQSPLYLGKDDQLKNQYVPNKSNSYSMSDLERNSFKDTQRKILIFGAYIAVACILYALFHIDPMSDALRVSLYFMVSCVIACFLLQLLGD